jgi:hypothetical protein
MRPFRTLHKRWLLSFTSLPTGREQSEGAGCGIPFFRSLLAVGRPSAECVNLWGEIENVSGSDPKRRIAPPERLDSGGRQALAAKLTYVGSALHKTKPGDYGFQPPVNPRPWKSICDGLRVI